MPQREDGGSARELNAGPAQLLKTFFAPVVALPPPPAPTRINGRAGESADVDPADGTATDDEHGGERVTFALWDQCARMIGPDGHGYSNALQLLLRLRDRHQQIMEQLYARFDRHHCALLVLRIINKEATKYGDDRSLTLSEGLTSSPEEWSWERLEDEDGGRFVLSLGASVDIEGCPDASRTFAGSLKWGEARHRTEQLLSDRDEAKDREAEILDYRIDVLEMALFQFETFGYVPLFGGAAGGFEGVSVEAASEVRAASEERQREEQWLFITEARHVIRSGTANASWTSVCDQVDTNLNGRNGVDWGGGRARKYARALGVLEQPRRRQGGATGTDTSQAYDQFKTEVEKLYTAGIAEGRSSL